MRPPRGALVRESKNHITASVSHPLPHLFHFLLISSSLLNNSLIILPLVLRHDLQIRVTHTHGVSRSAQTLWVGISRTSRSTSCK